MLQRQARGFGQSNCSNRRVKIVTIQPPSLRAERSNLLAMTAEQLLKIQHLLSESLRGLAKQAAKKNASITDDPASPGRIDEIVKVDLCEKIELVLQRIRYIETMQA